MGNIVTFPKSRARKKRRPSFRRLSFIKRREGGDGYDYWAVTPSNDYGKDCERGAAFALEFMAYLVRSGPTNGDSALLASITCDIAKKGHASGLVVGFMGTLGRVFGAQLSIDVVMYARKTIVARRRAYKAALRTMAAD